MRTVAELAGELAASETALDRIAPTDSGDPALSRLGATALRQHHRGTDSQLALYTKQAARVAALRFALVAAEAREAEARRVPLTAADIHGARLVRDRIGWHKVIRCSAKSVTVETGHSWTDRIDIGKILEVRA
jgi:hypothetical protein